VNLKFITRNFQTDAVSVVADIAPAKIIAAEEAFKDSAAMSNAHYILKDRDIEMKLF